MEEDITKNVQEAEAILLITNIPTVFHTAEMRNFFSSFVEEGKFTMFHFRHRPLNNLFDSEDEILRNIDEIKVNMSSFFGQNLKLNKNHYKNSNCCILKLPRHHIILFLELYQWKTWENSSEDNFISCEKCIIASLNKFRINIPDLQSRKVILPVLSLSNKKKVFQFPELNPPSVMPNGNVGTSTKYLLNLINQCKLSSRLIGKLGLEFPRVRAKRKYGAVNFNYKDFSTNSHINNYELNDVNLQSPSRSSEDCYNSRQLLARLNKNGPNISDDLVQGNNTSDEDNDTCEEWERHESLHNDYSARRQGACIYSQEGTKERLFEEEIELKWEKGGSGLVFYTDAQFWKEKEGDFDEQNTDDWDVDTSGYYGKPSTKDGADLVEILKSRSSALKCSDSIFKKKTSSKQTKKCKKIGEFEKYTKGIGRKIMESQGWKDGQGLGKTVTGISEIIEGNGQNANDKRGFGYHGEKIDRLGLVRSMKTENSFKIGTAFDSLNFSKDHKNDKFRSDLPTVMKNRKN